METLTKGELIDAILGRDPTYDRGTLSNLRYADVMATWHVVRDRPLRPVEGGSTTVQTTVDDATVERLLEARVNAVRDELLAVVRESAPVAVTLVRPDSPPINAGQQHRQFGTLARLLEAGVDPWIWGAPGGGKTTAASEYARALGIPFFYICLNGQSTKSELAGYQDAQGRPVYTVLRKAAESTGPAVLLIDEADKAPSGVAAALHSVMSQRILNCPDATVDVNPELRIIAAANTQGTGARAGHESAQRVDDALRDRFVFLEWEYDTALERNLATAINPGALSFVRWVQGLRVSIATQGWKFHATPRAILAGARLLSAGFAPAEVADMTVFKGCDRAHRAAALDMYPVPA